MSITDIAKHTAKTSMPRDRDPYRLLSITAAPLIRRLGTALTTKKDRLPSPRRGYFHARIIKRTFSLLRLKFKTHRQHINYYIINLL